MTTKRMIAAAQGKKIFEGNVCPRCGTKEKYTSGGGCVCCIKKQAKAFNAIKQAKIREMLKAAQS